MRHTGRQGGPVRRRIPRGESTPAPKPYASARISATRRVRLGCTIRGRRLGVMGIGTALAFIALGAILAFATHFSVSGIDVQMIGWILIFVGIAMLVITLAYTRPRRRRAVVRDVDVVDG